MADDPPPPPAPFPWLRPHGRPWRADAPPEALCENPWFAVESYRATAPTGAPAGYYVQRYRNAAVGVLPLHDDGTVSLVGQWRFPLNRYNWEIPEGGAPHGEPPLDGARRELREEAGLQAADWRLILTLELSNASSDELAYIYLATGLTPCDREPEATEELALARPPFTQVLHAAVTGAIQDSLTVAAVLRLHHMATTGEFAPDLARAALGR